MGNFPFREAPLFDGVQRRYTFDNGYEASVYRHTYMGADGKWSVAVFYNDLICRDTEIGTDAVDHLSEEQMEELLVKISKLPERSIFE